MTRALSGKTVLVTGGAGFIGCNLADRAAAAGARVIVLDSLARGGVKQNLDWLIARHGAAIEARVADVRDAAAVADAVDRADLVYHFAAQVAVTTSLEDPIADFEVNARGTLHVLEAIRRREDPPSLVFTSTNKVYGALPDVEMVEEDRRWKPADADLRARGIDESRPLDFHSPYGCSKGTADQYVIDYARTFGIPATVFRMSCIYGPRQFGTEDQGWVAHFLIRAIDGEPITLYGDGKQVRDILFVEDLVDALVLAQERIGELSGRAFNIGGGPERTVSLLEILERIGSLRGTAPEASFAEWRPGDQRYYVSDTTAFQRATGWRPKVSVEEGVARLHAWLQESRGAAAAQPARRSA